MRGFDHYKAGEWADAERDLRPLAVAGCAEAQAMLGTVYQLGLGCMAVPAETERWYRMAADQGHALAAWNLGTECAALGRADEATLWKK